MRKSSLELKQPNTSKKDETDEEDLKSQKHQIPIEEKY